MAVNFAVVLDAPEGHGASARWAFTARQLGDEGIPGWKRTSTPDWSADSSDSNVALDSIGAHLQANGPAAEMVLVVDTVKRRVLDWSHVRVVLRSLIPEARTDRPFERISALGPEPSALKCCHTWTTSGGGNAQSAAS